MWTPAGYDCQKDPDSSQSQTGNNGFYDFFVVVLGRVEVKERIAGERCPQINEAQATVIPHLKAFNT